MISILLALIFIAFTVFACLPSGMGLGWSAEVINFLKGFAPFFTAFVGLIALFIGISDIKDKNEAKKEEKAAQLAEKQEKTENN